jgi:hypothetical protein
MFIAATSVAFHTWARRMNAIRSTGASGFFVGSSRPFEWAHCGSESDGASKMAHRDSELFTKRQGAKPPPRRAN